eukprot:scpid100162/ scgid26995/ 
MLLSRKQSSEMVYVCSTISAKNGDVLEDVVREAGEHGATIQNIWKDDISSAKAEFEKDQTDNTTGSHGNQWSATTYRMALAMFSLSPAAYKSLKSFGVLQLSSTRSL